MHLSSVWSDLRQSLLVLNLAGPQEPEDVLGPLGDGVLHPVVMPQLFDAQLHPTEIVVTCEVRDDVSQG